MRGEDGVGWDVGVTNDRGEAVRRGEAEGRGEGVGEGTAGAPAQCKSRAAASVPPSFQLAA